MVSISCTQAAVAALARCRRVSPWHCIAVNKQDRNFKQIMTQVYQKRNVGMQGMQ